VTFETKFFIKIAYLSIITVLNVYIKRCTDFALMFTYMICTFCYTVRPRLFDNPLFEYPALFEVDWRSRFYLYINQNKYERIIWNALSEYLLFFEVKFRSRLYNYERISHLLFEASLIIIRSQTNWRRSTRWQGRHVKNINSHACI
jgi:hypothetical protein